MSKNLKEEYEQMLDSGMPDLWSRIEPQLHEKTVEKKTFGKNKRRYMYSGMAAACLCLVIAIPVMIRTMNTGHHNETNMIAADDSTGSNGTYAAGTTDAGEEADMDSWMNTDEDGYAKNDDADMSNEIAADDVQMWTEESCEITQDMAEDTVREADGIPYTRLTADTGEKLEVEGSIIRAYVEEDVTGYEMLITSVDGQTVSGEENRIYAISAARRTEEWKADQPADTVHAVIQWDEKRACYRILEIK